MPHTTKTIRKLTPTARRIARAARDSDKLTRFLDIATSRVHELEQIEAHNIKQLAAAYQIHADAGWIRLDMADAEAISYALRIIQAPPGYTREDSPFGITNTAVKLTPRFTQLQEELQLCQSLR